jgi:hypothetical protein
VRLIFGAFFPLSHPNLILIPGLDRIFPMQE